MYKWLYKNLSLSVELLKNETQLVLSKIILVAILDLSYTTYLNVYMYLYLCNSTLYCNLSLLPSSFLLISHRPIDHY